MYASGAQGVNGAPVLGWSVLFALLPTVIAYLLYYRGMQKIRDSSQVPVLASVECVVAVSIGVLALHERSAPSSFWASHACSAPCC